MLHSLKRNGAVLRWRIPQERDVLLGGWVYVCDECDTSAHRLAIVPWPECAPVLSIDEGPDEEALEPGPGWRCQVHCQAPNGNKKKKKR